MKDLRLQQVDFRPTPEGYQPENRQPEFLRGLYATDVAYEDVLEKFKEGNETYDVVIGPAGRPYEIAIFNADQLDQALIAKPSTSFSSLHKNPGNALQTALSAAANPGAAYVYIGSFGNHPTGHLDREDLRHIRRTGRYTLGMGTLEQPYRPLGSLVDLAETLTDRGLAPTHFSADAEAGRLALGLMAALEPDSIKGAYLNGIDGISPNARYVKAQLSEDLRSRIYRRGIGAGQPGEVTPVNIKDVKRHMPNIYHGLGRIAHLAPLPVLLYPVDMADKIQLTLGFRGHNDLNKLPDHAVYQDTRAALERQDSIITLQFNSESAIHDIEDCKRFGKLVMDSLPYDKRTSRRRVRLLIGEGTQDQRTDNPKDYARIERYALPDILHQMSSLVGGLLDATVFDLPLPRRQTA